MSCETLPTKTSLLLFWKVLGKPPLIRKLPVREQFSMPTECYTCNMRKSLETGLQIYLQSLVKISKSTGYPSPEAFINLPFDENNIKRVMEVAKETPETDLIVVIGIGGSSLGAKAVYKALEKQTSTATKIIFLDQINVEKIQALAEELETNQKSAVIVTISKSGKTFETLKNYEILRKSLSKSERLKEIIITEETSDLALKAEEEKIPTLSIPEKVGGRFSIFSPAGLLPLTLAKIDVIELLKGAMLARQELLNKNSAETVAQLTKVFQDYQKGKELYNIFIFSPKLKTLGLWYRQLLAESLGKKGTGLFPTISEGSKDLHSLQQYFVGGKQNVQHEFIITEDENQYQKNILRAVQETYEEQNIPFRTTTLPKTDEKSLGFFMETKMIEILLLARLLDINPFGQPDVDSYKRKIKEA